MKSIRILLLPFSILYWFVITARNWFFDIGILKVTRLTVPVVSVGNISTGGTGKTPLVEVIVQKLRARGRKPAVLSRGYGRRTRGFLLVSRGENATASVLEAGDEPVQLAEKLKDVIVAVGENRVDAAKKILAETSADCIVLDDGFQHRYLYRDLDIVLLTAGELDKPQWLLPVGSRRERMTSLRRADAVVTSKCKDAPDFKTATTRLQGNMPNNIAGFRLVPSSMRRVSNGECIKRRIDTKVPVMIFSGIGDPNSFRQSVEDFGFLVKKSIVFADHHWYSGADLDKLRSEFSAEKMELMITTQKDLVRLRSLKQVSDDFFKQLPVHVLEVVPEFVGGEELIDKLIEKILP